MNFWRTQFNQHTSTVLLLLRHPRPEKVANPKSALSGKMSGFAWMWQKASEPMVFTSGWHLVISWNHCTSPTLHRSVLSSPDLLGFQFYCFDAFCVLCLARKPRLPIMNQLLSSSALLPSVSGHSVPSLTWSGYLPADSPGRHSVVLMSWPSEQGLLGEIWTLANSKHGLANLLLVPQFPCL